MSRKKIAEWQPLETAPKDGTELIFWVSSQKRFQDTTANFYFSEGQWWWADTEDVLKRPDLVNGCAVSAAAYSREKEITMTDHVTVIRREPPLVSALSLSRRLRRVSQAY
jgi:hypothetical protein